MAREHHETAVNRALSTVERIKALEALRQIPDGRSREVTVAMVELIQNPDIGSRFRAHIIRNLDGVTFEELKEPLIQALLNDPDHEVREETAETLWHYLGDPRVMEAMEYAKENDAARNVREEAARRIEVWKYRQK